MAKNGFVAWMDNLPKILKIIFCIPFLDVIWSVYRIIKHVTQFNLIRLIISIIMVIGSFSIGWILDLIWVILFDKPFIG
ncbi:MAG: hypothetical protein J6B16_03160 [Clostridia bacterium]|nr:hypothetical protein [Clostridia bacterium]